MILKHLITGLGVTLFAAVAEAGDKPKLPHGPPPRLATILEKKADSVVYQDFYFAPPIPKKFGQLDTKKPVPSHPSAGPMFAIAVEFSFKGGQVFDVAGKKLNAEAAKKRLAVGETVLVSMSSGKVDPAYLRVLKKTTLILVHPVPQPGPALPKLPPKRNK
jgi:hypothetical protein